LQITFFGLTLSSSWGNGHATPLRAIIRAVHRLGHRVTFFEKDVPYYAQHRDLSAPDYCTLRFYDDWLNVRREALAAASASDVFITTSFLPDGAEVLDELLPISATASRPLRVYYDLDTPVTLSRWERGEEVSYITPEQLAAFDLVLSFTGGRTLREVERYGVERSAAIYGCVDPDVHFRTQPSERFKSEFSYMGTYSPDRQHKLDALFFAAARQFAERKFLVVGSLFPEGLDWPQNVWYQPHLAPGDHAAFYSSSRATLNITRGEMAAYGHCPSGRFFEAAACGTPLITDYFPGLEEFFDPYSELVVARETSDVTFALHMPDSDLRRIAAAARERTLDEHTGTVRARQMLAAFEQARSRSFMQSWVEAA
jgi:spore maturation protein CgeB